MKREDISRMAREAGWFEGKESDVCIACSQFGISRFAALVAAHEREECAKVCDVLAVHPEYASQITKLAATAIRGRK
jgi:hypothetical protein